MKLKEYLEVKGAILLKEGLRVGGTKEAVGIGETDNPIIRHPITRKPYLPGSSIKGKVRSLLEQKYSESSQRTGRPCDCASCFICSLFGCGNPSKGTEPSRLIFRDAPLVGESEKELDEGLPGSFAEVKTEIAMDRNKGRTITGSLRTQERIPAGAKFDFSFTIRLFEEDNPRRADYLNKLAEAFEMLEKDYLGGSGTRGYGQVEVMTSDLGRHMFEHLRGLAKS
jgi:CRISPR-associated protein Csm3